MLQTRAGRFLIVLLDSSLPSILLRPRRRAQKLCVRVGLSGRPWYSNSPYRLCGDGDVGLNVLSCWANIELRRCVKVEVDVLGSRP